MWAAESERGPCISDCVHSILNNLGNQKKTLAADDTATPQYCCGVHIYRGGGGGGGGKWKTECKNVHAMRKDVFETTVFNIQIDG